MSNYNMYDLVDQMEKNKAKSQAQANREIDDLFSSLDNRKNISEEEVRQKVNRMNPDSDLSGLGSSGAISASRRVYRPILPNHVGDYDTRYNCFLALINSVEYGSANNQDYVRGHKDALNKYANLAENNPENLSLTEAAINDEIVRTSSISAGMYQKGYTDGMDYVYLSLKRSKEEMAKKIANILR